MNGYPFFPANPISSLPIGVFDSGVGGLTVLAAMRRRLPGENLLYLADTARVPYGTRSDETITRYSIQATEALVNRGIRMLVVACNTVTAAALPAMREAYPHLPMIGVVEPGVKAAAQVSRSGRIAVLATESTVRNAAYTKGICALRPDAQVRGIACSLFVALAEEGWMTGPVAEGIAARYLAPLLADPPEQRIDCLVLGCTHFPPLAPAIRAVMGNSVALVDPAAATAETVAEMLERMGPESARHAQGAQAPVPRFLVTDAPERFARVGSLLLEETITTAMVEVVNLQPADTP